MSISHLRALTPPKPRLQVATNPAFAISSGTRPLTTGEVPARATRFQAMARNISRFSAVASESFLNRVLTLSGEHSFMNQALGELAREAGIRNLMTDLLTSHHTSYASLRSGLGWMGIYGDLFTTYPIPGNIAANAIASGSLEALKVIAGDPSNLFTNLRNAVLNPQLRDGQMELPGLRVEVQANSTPVIARPISAASSTISHEGRTYFNGLPGDRGTFPSVILPQDSRIGIEVGNTTADKYYGVTPFINGMPLTVESLGFSLAGFENSPFPAVSIEPFITYIGPGKSMTFNRFKVERTGIYPEGRSTASWTSFLGEYGGNFEELAALLSADYEAGLSDDDRQMLSEGPLADHKNRYLRNFILFEQYKRYAKELLAFWAQARECEILIGKPVFADGTLSDALANPLLGTVGLSVFEVSQPPEKPRHYGGGFGGEALMRGGPQTFGGGIGLASIGGGADLAGSRRGFEETYKFDTWNHTFVGHLTANLLSPT